MTTEDAIQTTQGSDFIVFRTILNLESLGKIIPTLRALTNESVPFNATPTISNVFVLLLYLLQASEQILKIFVS